MSGRHMFSENESAFHALMTAHLTGLPVSQALAYTDETSAWAAQAC